MDNPGYHHRHFTLAQFNKNLIKIYLKDLIKTAVATSANLDAYSAGKCAFKPLMIKAQYRAHQIIFSPNQISAFWRVTVYQFLRAKADNPLNAGTRDAANFSAASRSILLPHLC